MQRLYLFLLFFIILSFNHSDKKEILTKFSSNGGLTDKKATNETRSLYKSLKEISQNHILYGHQDDMACGVGWWAKEGRSDVKEVCGSYPSVFGWELGNLGNERNIDSVLFRDIKKWIIKVYEMGGANTVSWHLSNPVSLKNSWDVTKALPSILPGGEKHNYYKQQLQLFGKFNSELLSSKGVQIPIILRVFHEQNANWYWWGKKHCTSDEYKSLFRFTVNYLQDSLNIHNLIYVYAPDGQYEDYLERYPGDEYIDILGFDYYFRNEINDKELNIFTRRMIEISELAKTKNKLAAISETGYESIPDSLWHSRVILKPIEENNDKIKLGYFLVWRNKSKTSYFAPFVGHSSCNDFKSLNNNKRVLFLNSTPNLYSPQ